MFWNYSSKTDPIGLIAGEGEFPVLLARTAASLKKRVIAFGINDCVDKSIEQYVSEIHYVSFGSVGRLLELLKEKRIKRVVLAGGVPKSQLGNPDFQMDAVGKNVIQRIANKGDDHLIRAFQLLLKAKCGISVMDPRVLLKEAMAPKGLLTRRHPSLEEWADLKFGYKIAKRIGKMDIGQTIVVKNGVVVAVEALEGTDQAIRRAGQLIYGNCVVVKTAKPQQDLKFDLPCIGLKTLASLKAAQSRVLGIESRKTILLSKKELIDAANEEDVTIVGL